MRVAPVRPSALHRSLSKAAARDKLARMAAGPEHPYCALFLDLVMRPLNPVRDKVVPQATGRVLEVGVGTGMNLSRYASIEALYGIEPDPHMLKKASRRTKNLPFPVRLEQTGAEALPYPDDFFDTAVMTWVLCTIPEPERALREVHRVLKPGGKLLYAEHTRSRYPMAASIQDRLTPYWAKLGGGCQLNRDSIPALRATGFKGVTVKPCGRESWNLVPVYRGLAFKVA